MRRTFCVGDGMHWLVLLSLASELCVSPPTTAINVLKFCSWRRRCHTPNNTCIAIDTEIDVNS